MKMRNYIAEFFDKDKDGNDIWRGYCRFSRLDDSPVALPAQAFRQAPEKCRNARKVIIELDLDINKES